MVFTGAADIRVHPLPVHAIEGGQRKATQLGIDASGVGQGNLPQPVHNNKFMGQRRVKSQGGVHENLHGRKREGGMLDPVYVVDAARVNSPPCKLRKRARIPTGPFKNIA
jgi:hypothetical protein